MQTDTKPLPLGRFQVRERFGKTTYAYEIGGADLSDTAETARAFTAAVEDADALRSAKDSILNLFEAYRNACAIVRHFTGEDDQAMRAMALDLRLIVRMQIIDLIRITIAK